MVITGFVGKNPKESSSIRASTISGYKALNCGKTPHGQIAKHHKLQPGYRKRNKSHQETNLTMAAMFPPVKDRTYIFSWKHSLFEYQLLTNQYTLLH